MIQMNQLRNLSVWDGKGAVIKPSSFGPKIENYSAWLTLPSFIMWQFVENPLEKPLAVDYFSYPNGGEGEGWLTTKYLYRSLPAEFVGQGEGKTGKAPVFIIHSL